MANATIEFKQQHIPGTPWGHLYWVFKDSNGNQITEINFLGTDPKTGNNLLIGNNSDDLKMWTSGTSMPGTVGYYNRPESDPGQIVFSGSDEQVQNAAKHIISYGLYINNNNIKYGKIPTQNDNDFNSNSGAAYTGQLLNDYFPGGINQSAYQEILNRKPDTILPGVIGIPNNPGYDRGNITPGVLWNINSRSPATYNGISVYGSELTIVSNGVKVNGTQYSDKFIQASGLNNTFLSGGAGNDIYEFGSSSYGRVIEVTNGGTDKIILSDFNNNDYQSGQIYRTTINDKNYLVAKDDAGKEVVSIELGGNGSIETLELGDGTTVDFLQIPHVTQTTISKYISSLQVIVNPEDVPEEGDRAEEAKEGVEDSENTASPIIFDLDGDGLDLIALNSSNTSFFDIDADGFAEQTGWITSDDGFLALDVNNNGLIDNTYELFGTPITSGFHILQAYDDNQDGVIDVQDGVFNNLLIWRDLNTNGYTDAGETKYLDYYNILNINLNSTRVGIFQTGHFISDVSTALKAGGSYNVYDVWFTFNQMNTRYHQDYALDVRVNSMPGLRGYGEIADLHIEMSLENGAGGLLEKVEAFAAQGLNAMVGQSFAALKGDIYEIMYDWADVEGVAPGSRGAFVDARQLAYLEKMTGEDYYWVGPSQPPGPNPPIQAGLDIGRTFFEDSMYIAARLAVQGAAKSLFTGTPSYDLNADAFTGAGALNTATLSQITTLAKQQGADALSIWTNVLMIVTGVRGNFENLSEADISALTSAIKATHSSLTFTGVNNNLYGYDPNLAIAPTTRGDDILTGAAGNDLLNGGDGNDLLYGYAGHDTLSGGADNDRLYGGAGDDLLEGGDGADRYYFNKGNGNDIIRELNTAGTDEIIFGAGIKLSDLTFTRLTNEHLGISIRSAAGGGSMIIEEQFTGEASAKNNKIEQIRFSDNTLVKPDSLNYTLNGSALAETLHGVRNGTGVNDTIYGHGGNDTIYGYIGADTLHGGDGDDTIYGADMHNKSETTSNILKGDAGNDYLEGAAGTDHLTGGTGNDTLLGDGGEDHYYFDYGDGNDTIMPTTSTRDVLHFGAGITKSMLSYSLTDQGANLFIKINGGTGGSINILGQFRAQSSFYGLKTAILADGTVLDLINQDYAWSGTEEADTIYGRYYIAGKEAIRGLGGNDVLMGGGGDDVLYGDAGDDEIHGDNGNDLLEGGLNNDDLRGGAGADTLNGGDGNDALYGENDHDILDGGAGDDFLSGGSGTDTASYASATAGVTVNLALITAQNTIGAGTDTIDTIENLTGSAYNDTLRGTTGVNVMNGGNGNDIIYGNSGNDTIYGGAGNDTLYGDAGNDIIFGNAGTDKLYGGAGADTFKFQSGGGIDTIKDFKLSELDKLDIKDLLSGYTSTKAITDFIQITTSGANSIVKIDANGTTGGVAWTQIATIEGVTGLTDELALKNAGTIIV